LPAGATLRSPFRAVPPSTECTAPAPDVIIAENLLAARTSRF
jgi:hypothetical protein